MPVKSDRCWNWAATTCLYQIQGIDDALEKRELIKISVLRSSEIEADEALFEENGRLALEKADLLAYSHGEYFVLGEKLGKFGYSVKKTK